MLRIIKDLQKARGDLEPGDDGAQIQIPNHHFFQRVIPKRQNNSQVRLNEQLFKGADGQVQASRGVTRSAAAGALWPSTSSLILRLVAKERP